MLKKQDMQKANAEFVEDDALYYESMKKILNLDRLKLTLHDKEQMFTLVDKCRNQLHQIDINKECAMKAEQLTF